jgi:hypothetical protein
MPSVLNPQWIHYAKRAWDSVPKWFLNTSIATRLGLGFGALVLLIVIFDLSALQQMNRLEKQSDTLYHHPFTVTRSVDAVIIEALKIHREMKDLGMDR